MWIVIRYLLSLSLLPRPYSSLGVMQETPTDVFV